MEVILKEDIIKLGHRGDVVKVAEGYGRNYLIPQKLAIEATAGNKAVIEQMKAASVRKSAKEKGSAEALGQQLSAVVVEFTRKSGEHDQLFGSVTSSDIAQALEAKGFSIDRRKIVARRSAEDRRHVRRAGQAAPRSDGEREGRGEERSHGRSRRPRRSSC